MKRARIALLSLCAAASLCAEPATGGGPVQAPRFVVQTGHPDSIGSLAVSPDGRLLLSADDDGGIRLWDLALGLTLRSMHAGSGVSHIAFSPDARLALASCFDGSLELWDIAAGRPLRSMKSGRYSMGPALFLPGAGTALSADFDGKLRLWDLESGAALAELGGPGEPVALLALSPDGRRALSCDLDGTTLVWDLAGRRRIAELEPAEPKALALAFSPDGKLALSAHEDGAIVARDARTGRLIGSTEPWADDFRSAAFSPDRSVVAFGLASGAVALLDAASGDASLVLEGHENIAFCFAFLPSGEAFLSGSGDCSIRLWDARSGDCLRVLPGELSHANALALSSDGRLGALAYGEDEIALWDLAEGRVLRSLHGELEPYVYFSSLALAGPWIAAGSSDSSIHVWDAATGSEHRVLPGHADTESPIWCLAATLDGGCVLSSGTDASVRMTDLRTGDSAVLGQGSLSEARAVKALAVSPDGEFAASGSEDGLVVLWDLVALEEAGAVELPGLNLSALAFSPDGGRLAAGCFDGSLVAFDLGSGAQVLDFRAHDRPISSLAFSADGRSFITASWDGTLRLWDAASGARLDELRGHSSRVSCAAWSADGRRALSGSDDGSLALWDMDARELLFTGVAAAGRRALGAGCRWLAATPDGYWDASADGGDLVAMVLDPSPGEPVAPGKPGAPGSMAFRAFAVDQFAVLGNRPDIIASRSGADPALVELFRSRYAKRLRKLGMADDGAGGADAAGLEPPAATIESFRTEGRRMSLELRFEARSAELARYSVYLNDVPLFGAAGKALSGRSASVSEVIELGEGENEVEIACMDSGGRESYRALARARAEPAAARDLYYVAFGVSAYADPRIQDLSYAAKDAIDLGSRLASLEGKGFAKVRSYVRTDAAVTREGILGAGAFLAAARRDDLVVLFISGHGIQLAAAAPAAGAPPSSEGSAAGTMPGASVRPSEYTYYYVTADARLDDLPGSAADFELVESLLQGIAPLSKLFLMDTCESGEAEEGGSGGLPGQGTRSLRPRALGPASTRGLAVVPRAARASSAGPDRWIFNDLTRRSGAVVLSSSRGDEYSLESDEWAQGAFTKAVLGALGGAGDADGDDILDSAELRAYVEEEVPRLTADLQHPTVDRDNLSARIAFPCR